MRVATLLALSRYALGQARSQTSTRSAFKEAQFSRLLAA